MRPSKEMIFNKLNETRHTQDENTQYSLFPNAHPDTRDIHAEFWYYSDLHNLLGNIDFPTSNTPHTMIGHARNKMHFPKDVDTIPFFHSHVADAHHEFYLDGTHYKNATDLELSRYACWALSRENPGVIFARTYFLSPVMENCDTFIDIKNQSYQFARINLRERLKEYEKILAGILNKYGADFSRFNHSMTMGFFYGYSANDLKDYYNIPSNNNDPIANYMGAASLHARICALHNTINKFNQSPIKNRETIYSILHNELIQQRVNTIKSHNTAPEQDIYPTPVSKIEKQLKDTEKKFIEQYSKIKIR